MEVVVVVAVIAVAIWWFVRSKTATAAIISNSVRILLIGGTGLALLFSGVNVAIALGMLAYAAWGVYRTIPWFYDSPRGLPSRMRERAAGRDPAGPGRLPADLGGVLRDRSLVSASLAAAAVWVLLTAAGEPAGLALLLAAASWAVTYGIARSHLGPTPTTGLAPSPPSPPKASADRTEQSPDLPPHGQDQGPGATPPAPTPRPPAVPPPAVPPLPAPAPLPAHLERVVDRLSAATGASRLAVILGGCAAVGVVLLTGIFLVDRALSPPTTRRELCSAYDGVLSEWFDFSTAGDFFDDEAFDALERLADVAQRYPGSAAVRRDGDALEHLAEGDGGLIVTVSTFEVDRDSSNIARECGPSGPG